MYEQALESVCHSFFWYDKSVLDTWFRWFPELLVNSVFHEMNKN